MLATGCAMGEIEECKCRKKNVRDLNKNTNQCAHLAIEYGYFWSKQFIDTEFVEGDKIPGKRKSSSPASRNSKRRSARRAEEQRMLNLYNGEAGRMVSF